MPGLSEAGKQAKRITSRMVLAHTTGIPMSAEGQVPTFLFEPGTEYGYNGVPLVYLQMALEEAMDLDPKSKTGIVYFTNSPNGDVLAKDITDDIVNVKDGLSYISEKYGFATKFEEDWEAKQQQRFDKVGYYFEFAAGMHTSEAEWVAEEKSIKQINKTHRSTHYPIEIQ